MDADILGAGVVDGIVSGFICGIMVSTFQLLFFMGYVNPGGPMLLQPPVPPISRELFLFSLILWGLFLGAILGLIFCYFNRSIKNHVQKRRGFKYGAVLSLSYAAISLPLMNFLGALYIIENYYYVYYVISLALPVFLFGSLLVLIWNWNWRI